MAMALMQMGSKGAMRDLDYINPRMKVPPQALPPEVRRKLGLDKGERSGPAADTPQRSASVPPTTSSEHEVIYKGAANAEPKVGMSGAGTDWHNPNGHAFVRRGSGVPMSQRASRKAQLAGAAGGSSGGYGGGGGLPPPGPGMRTASLERRGPPLAPTGGNGGADGRPLSRNSSVGGGSGSSHGTNHAREQSRERRRVVSLQLPPKAPQRSRSMPGGSPP